MTSAQVKIIDDFNLDDVAYKLTEGNHERVCFELKDREELLKLSEYFTQVVTQENCPDTVKNKLIRIGLIGGQGSGKSSITDLVFEKAVDFQETNTNRHGQRAGPSNNFGHICRVDFGYPTIIENYYFSSWRKTENGLELLEHVHRDWRSSESYPDDFEAIHALIGVQRSVDLNQFNQEIEETSRFELEILCGPELTKTDGWKKFVTDTQDFRI